MDNLVVLKLNGFARIARRVLSYISQVWRPPEVLSESGPNGTQKPPLVNVADDFEIRLGTTEQIELQPRRPNWQEQPRRIVGIPNRKQVQVTLSESALAQAHGHAMSSSNEVGGALIGQAYTWRGQMHVEINATLPGRMTRAGPAHVTFTADTWADLLQRKDQEFPNQMIVGWYHSHPRMGIFLSGLDLSIQENFLKHPWQVALVINAQDLKGGFFIWDQKQIKPASGFYFVDIQQPQSPTPMGRNSERSFSYKIAPVHSRSEARSFLYSWRSLLVVSLLILFTIWLYRLSHRLWKRLLVIKTKIVVALPVRIRFLERN